MRKSIILQNGMESLILVWVSVSSLFGHPYRDVCLGQHSLHSLCSSHSSWAVPVLQNKNNKNFTSSLTPEMWMSLYSKSQKSLIHCLESWRAFCRTHGLWLLVQHFLFENLYKHGPNLRTTYRDACLGEHSLHVHMAPSPLATMEWYFIGFVPF